MATFEGDIRPLCAAVKMSFSVREQSKWIVERLDRKLSYASSEYR